MPRAYRVYLPQCMRLYTKPSVLVGISTQGGIRIRRSIIERRFSFDGVSFC